MLESIARARLYRSLRHVQSRIKSSSEPARMNPRHAAGEDHDSSRPLDDTSHRQVHEGILAGSSYWSLWRWLDCINVCVINASLLSYVQSRIESSQQPARMNLHCISEGHESLKRLDGILRRRLPLTACSGACDAFATLAMP